MNWQNRADRREMTAIGELLAETARQHLFLDMLTASFIAEYRAIGGKIFCTRSCSSCCTLAVNCTLIEAFQIAAALDGPQAGRIDDYVVRLTGLLSGVTDLKDYLQLHRRQLGNCPLLDDEGACGMYALRPLSCRALLSTREHHWCAVDFSTLAKEEKQSFMAELDRTAVAFPTHYLAASRDSGQELEMQSRLQMIRSFGCSLYGSMPVLVHLLRRRQLMAAVTNGREAVVALLHESGLDHPLLLDLEGV